MNWTFGGPFGTQAMVEVPLSEIILLQRHLEVPEVHSWLSSNALNDIRDPATPEPTAVDDAGHSAQKFVIDVVVRRAKEQRLITARGRDIYAFSAPLVCEALERLLTGTFYKVGAHAPGATLDARGVLSKLVPEHLALEFVTG